MKRIKTKLTQTGDVCRGMPLTLAINVVKIRALLKSQANNRKNKEQTTKTKKRLSSALDNECRTILSGLGCLCAWTPDDADDVVLVFS